MRFRSAETAALLGICVAATLAVAAPPPKAKRGGAVPTKTVGAKSIQPVTQRDVAAVLLAIKDEVYAGGCAPAFMDIGKPAGHGAHEINVYFSPSFRDGYSWTVYKFWPFGEVYRMYWVDKAGLAHLAGHPDWGFPPTEPSYLTIYMGDSQLCRLKAQWKLVPLDIKINPGEDRVREAVQRQKERGGDLHVCRGQWRGNIFIPQQP